MFKNWFTKKSQKPETYSSTPLDELMRLQANSAAGVAVTETTALNLVSVYACVRAIAETLASISFPVYERLDGGGKGRLRDHPVYRLLNVSPDDEISAMQWRESGIGHLLTWGNWYNEIEFSNGGEVLAVHLLNPKIVTPRRTKSGRIEYKLDGVITPIPAERMLHVAGLGYDGCVGYSPCRMGKSAISLGIAAERFGQTWFGNGSRGQGYITHPGTLSDQAKANIRASIEAEHAGPDQAHRWMIFEEGIQVEQLGVPPEDAQFLATRLFQLQEICRLYRISPALVGDLSRSTFSNQEQESINFVVHTLRPWCRRIETQINQRLFSRVEQETIFAEHLLDGLLRGDQQTRYAAYATGRQWGWLSADDINELENRNPLPDGQGKVYLIPLNFQDSRNLIKTEQPTPEQPVVPTTPSDAAVTASLDCVQDNIDRMLRRESEAVRKAATKPNEFLDAVEEFYSSYSKICNRALEPSLKAFAAIKADQFSDPMQKLDCVQQVMAATSNLVESGRKSLLDLSGTVSAKDLPQAIEKWTIDRATVSKEIIKEIRQ